MFMHACMMVGFGAAASTSEQQQGHARGRALARVCVWGAHHTCGRLAT